MNIAKALLAACAALLLLTAPYARAPEEVALCVDLGAVGDEVCRVDIVCAQGRLPLAGQCASPRSGAARFALYAGDFPGGRPGEEFRFAVRLYAEEGGEFAETNACEPFAPSFGSAYRYAVTGSFADGFTLRPAR